MSTSENAVRAAASSSDLLRNSARSTWQLLGRTSVGLGGSGKDFTDLTVSFTGVSLFVLYIYRKIGMESENHWFVEEASVAKVHAISSYHAISFRVNLPKL